MISVRPSPTDLPPGGRGALVLSLDFELAWGFGGKVAGGSPLEESLLATRHLIPRFLATFEAHEVAATWAAVGALFASGWEEWDEARPRCGPAVASRYAMGRHGRDHGAVRSSIHFAPELLTSIAASPRQEIGTHTFSHYECFEDSGDAHAFREDLRAARRIAASRGVELRSMVFPRNQHRPEYDRILIDEGIRAFRGNPRAWMWRFESGDQGDSPTRRAGRWLDTYVPVSTARCTQSWGEVRQATGLSNVRASFFLRPAGARGAALQSRHFSRLAAAIRGAAKRGELLHLWWHPHNFAERPAESFSLLSRLLEVFEECRQRRGMMSLTMSDVHDRLDGERPASPRLAAATYGAHA